MNRGAGERCAVGVEGGGAVQGAVHRISEVEHGRLCEGRPRQLPNADAVISSARPGRHGRSARPPRCSPSILVSRGDLRRHILPPAPISSSSPPHIGISRAYKAHHSHRGPRAAGCAYTCAQYYPYTACSSPPSRFPDCVQINSCRADTYTLGHSRHHGQCHEHRRPGRHWLRPRAALPAFPHLCRRDPLLVRPRHTAPLLRPAHL